ncbi:hypothetical protein AALA83_16735 [Oscillospiraceae bacterium 44-5]
MQLVLSEARKQRSFRETWVGYLLATLLLFVLIYTGLGELKYVAEFGAYEQCWFTIQQDIRSYVGTFAAFLLVIGLSRLMCYETEQGTAGLVGTAAHGPALTWRAKIGFSLIYCIVVVAVLGIVTLGSRGAIIGFQGAVAPVSNCVYFESVPLSNLAYCIVQYGFLLLGALYFTGFILIVATLTKHTSFTVFLCGGIYLASLCYQFVIEYRLKRLAAQICKAIFQFSFCGFMQLESYRWFGWTGQWENVWKPIVFVLLATVLEFAVLWLLWRRKAKT